MSAVTQLEAQEFTSIEFFQLRILSLEQWHLAI